MATSGFTLLVVASQDGYIARRSGEPPSTWASAEEQAVFLAAVEAADWSVMGRITHNAAYRRHRRRIIFSRACAAPQWRTPLHLWLDPGRLTVADLAPLTHRVGPLRNGLILGGTGVHDWFHAQDAIDGVRLTIEPVRFGGGVPIFSDQAPGDALGAFAEKGWAVATDETLNDRGTRLVTLVKAAPEGR